MTTDNFWSWLEVRVWCHILVYYPTLVPTHLKLSLKLLAVWFYGGAEVNHMAWLGYCWHFSSCCVERIGPLLHNLVTTLAEDEMRCDSKMDNKSNLCGFDFASEYDPSITIIMV